MIEKTLFNIRKNKRGSGYLAEIIAYTLDGEALHIGEDVQYETIVIHNNEEYTYSHTIEDGMKAYRKIRAKK